jgi:hypothetical protein
MTGTSDTASRTQRVGHSESDAASGTPLPDRSYTPGRMSTWLVERRLRKTAARLRSLRSELEVLNEQIVHLGDDAADAELRALVSESPMGSEPREARAHADALQKHRDHVIGEIHRLEQQQDHLLDQLNAS